MGRLSSCDSRAKNRCIPGPEIEIDEKVKPQGGGGSPQPKHRSSEKLGQSIIPHQGIDTRCGGGGGKNVGVSAEVENDAHSRSGRNHLNICKFILYPRGPVGCRVPAQFSLYSVPFSCFCFYKYIMGSSFKRSAKTLTGIYLA